MALISSENFKFDFTIELCELNEEKNGNPYNSSVSIKVESDGFCGMTETTISAKNLRLFLANLTEMYNTLQGETVLKNLDYGSNLKIRCDKLGKFHFEGTIINDSFQQLQFNNIIDQTYMQDFIKNLLSEFGIAANRVD